MDDYINRRTAINACLGLTTYKTRRELVERVDSSIADENGWLGGIAECMDEIDDLPSADVQPRKTAEWVYGEKDGADGWYCSRCRFHIPWYYDYYGLKNINFIRDYHTCPHCDAKMLKYTGMKEKWDD